jgi:hypothetical protein
LDAVEGFFSPRCTASLELLNNFSVGWLGCQRKRKILKRAVVVVGLGFGLFASFSPQITFHMKNLQEHNREGKIVIRNTYNLLVT